MPSSRNIPLVTYVRRTLVARLALMATGIALGMAVGGLLPYVWHARPSTHFLVAWNAGVNPAEAAWRRKIRT